MNFDKNIVIKEFTKLSFFSGILYIKSFKTFPKSFFKDVSLYAASFFFLFPLIYANKLRFIFLKNSLLSLYLRLFSVIRVLLFFR